MKFESPRQGGSRTRGLRLTLFVAAGLAILLAFAIPHFGWVAVILIAAALYIRKEGGCSLTLEDEALRFSNGFIVATIDRGAIQRVRIRGGGLFPRELLIDGDVTVTLRDGKAQIRKTLLLPDEFSVPLADMRQRIEDWESGRTAATSI